MGNPVMPFVFVELCGDGVVYAELGKLAGLLRIAGQRAYLHTEVQCILYDGSAEPAGSEDGDFLVVEMGLRLVHEGTKL
jgi:hypothetical protein